MTDYAMPKGSSRANKRRASKPPTLDGQTGEQLKRNTGRPSMPFDPEIGLRLCELIATTRMGMQDALDKIKSDGEFETLPGLTTVYKWLAENEQFAKWSARARELQAETILDLAVKEAFEPRIGVITTDKEWGTETRTADNVERSKLIVQTLMRRAGQLAPKKYGRNPSDDAPKENGPLAQLQAALLSPPVKPGEVNE